MPLSGWWQTCSGRRRGSLMTPQVAGYGAGDSSRGLSCVQHGTGTPHASVHINLLSPPTPPRALRQLVGALDWIWPSPGGLTAVQGGGAARLVLAGTWIWCWELFVRGKLSLDKRPPTRPRLRPAPQIVEPAGTFPGSSSLVSYDPMTSAVGRITPGRLSSGQGSTAAMSGTNNIDGDRGLYRFVETGEGSVSDRLVEIRKLARPEPSYGWLSSSPSRSRSALGYSDRKLSASDAVKQTSGHSTQPIQRRPDGSGFLPARSTRHHSRPGADRADRADVARWPLG